MTEAHKYIYVREKGRTMKDVNRRLEKIEKQLSVGKEPKVLYIILNSTFPEGTTPYDPESYREWETFKSEEEKAKQIAKECGIGIVGFYVDPFREYEVRNCLPEGILSIPLPIVKTENCAF